MRESQVASGNCTAREASPHLPRALGYAPAADELKYMVGAAPGGAAGGLPAWKRATQCASLASAT
jgi:hypothetical protein